MPVVNHPEAHLSWPGLKHTVLCPGEHSKKTKTDTEAAKQFVLFVVEINVSGLKKSLL